MAGEGMISLIFAGLPGARKVRWSMGTCHPMLNHMILTKHSSFKTDTHLTFDISMFAIYVAQYLVVSTA